jgi:hypothetical protein
MLQFAYLFWKLPILTGDYQVLQLRETLNMNIIAASKMQSSLDIQHTQDVAVKKTWDVITHLVRITEDMNRSKMRYTFCFSAFAISSAPEKSVWMDNRRILFEEFTEKPSPFFTTTKLSSTACDTMKLSMTSWTLQNFTAPSALIFVG